MVSISSALRSKVGSFWAYFTCLSLLFFQAVIFISGDCAQPANPPQASGPIDIQANEQDFNDDQVIARGNVKVTYRDTVIHGPMVTLFRDPEGQPQRAVFVGHPDLVESDSKMTADTLTFEIANSKVVAQGHAHSEVTTSGDTDTDITPKAAPKAKTVAKQQPFKWPQQGDDDQKDTSSATKTDEVPADSGMQGSGSSSPVTASSKAAPKKKTDKSTIPEKIITDSEFQEYDKQSGHFDANGHVHVIHGDITIYADKLQLVYGTDNKPETALFTGRVSAFQDSNNTKSDMMTYHLATKRLQATGNVRSKVIQQKPANSKNGKKTDGDGNGNNASKNVVGQASNHGPGAAGAATVECSGKGQAKKVDDDTILITSDAQDYSKQSSKMTADGNVRVYYQDTIGLGPKAILVKNEQGKAERVIFTRRSQITQPGKRWIADKITLTVPNKKVLAEGNTKAFIIQNQSDNKQQHQPSGGLASTTNSSSALSASKVEAIQ